MLEEGKGGGEGREGGLFLGSQKTTGQSTWSWNISTRADLIVRGRRKIRIRTGYKTAFCVYLSFSFFFFSIFQFFSSSSCSSFFFLFIMVITVCHFVSFDRWNLWRNVHCPPAQWKPTDAGSCLIPAAARCSFNSLGFCLKNSFRLMDYYNLSFFFLFYF